MPIRHKFTSLLVLININSSFEGFPWYT